MHSLVYQSRLFGHRSQPYFGHIIREDGEDGGGYALESIGDIFGDDHTHTHPNASVHIHTSTPVTKSLLSLSFSPSFSAERLSVTLIRNGQSHIKHGGDEKGGMGDRGSLQMIWNQ